MLQLNNWDFIFPSMLLHMACPILDGILTLQFLDDVMLIPTVRDHRNRTCWRQRMIQQGTTPPRLSSILSNVRQCIGNNYIYAHKLFTCQSFFFYRFCFSTKFSRICVCTHRMCFRVLGAHNGKHSKRGGGIRAPLPQAVPSWVLLAGEAAAPSVAPTPPLISPCVSPSLSHLPPPSSHRHPSKERGGRKGIWNP
jgi:hypothetical protein